MKTPRFPMIEKAIRHFMETAGGHTPREVQQLREEREVVRRLDETVMAQWLHHKLAAAQNQPYEDGDTCEECLESIRLLLKPSVQSGAWG